MLPQGFQSALVYYFVHGGIFMWPLLLCSVVGLAVIAYKSVALWQSQRGAEALAARVHDLAQGGQDVDAEKACDSSALPVAAVLHAILSRRGQERTTIQRAAELAGAEQVAGMESMLTSLSAVSTVAPLLGFLGTVSGMIHAFQAIAVQGLGQPAVVANGIAEALITTAAGLIIAIPAFVAYTWFVEWVNGIALRLEVAGSHLLDVVAPAGGGE